jgi:hypothetical protein
MYKNVRYPSKAISQVVSLPYMEQDAVMSLIHALPVLYMQGFCQNGTLYSASARHF